MEHGFKLLEERYIKEIDSVGRLMLHEKSGARLFHVKNKDDNKVFSISFRTPPADDTGLTHILEHSVLSGSRKFPTKEPFVDLAKGSLNTFLNAMTFADKTMYPVASKNEKDFMNLMDVYLDAVFYPNIYKCREIFMQEGWHYSIKSKDEELGYKGVVYNEMLGVFSSPEELLFSKAMESLFPETSYGYEYGGNPDCIPNLGYEKFIDYHRKYYHPSNCYIYLYGNGDAGKYLEFINDNYLKYFDRVEVDSNLKMQRAFGSRMNRTWDYPAATEEEEQDKTYISLNYVTGEACDTLLSISLGILEYILLETPASPLKKALIDAEIGRDVLGHFDEGLLQPMFNIVLKDSNKEECRRFTDIVEKTLKGLVTNGIDKKLIEASINTMEFKFREADGGDTPKGLLYGVKIMDSWLYDEDPFKHLEYDSKLNEIKERAKGNFFEELIERYLINNAHSSLVMLVPKFGLLDAKADEMRKKLDDHKKSLSEEGLNELIEENIKLSRRQNEPDSEEDLLKIPLISLEDIDTKAEIPPLEVRQEYDTKVLYHEASTNQIVYLDLLFETASVPQELIPFVSLLSDILGMVDTKVRSYGELSNEIDIYTGGIDFNVEVYEEIDNKSCHPMFIVQSKALSHKLDNLCGLLNEIINTSKFESKKRLREIIRETRSEMEVELIDDGHVVSAKRLCSYFSDYAYQVEVMTGISYYNFISDLDINFSRKYNEIRENLEKTARMIFNRENLTVSVTCSHDDYGIFKENFRHIADNLRNEKYEKAVYDFSHQLKNEGFYTSGNVQFVSKGFNCRDLGYSYSGYMQVARNILSLDYLWNKVRAQGGAYGAFCKFEMSGNVFFTSYRDPNIKNTLKVYDEIYDYLKDIDISEREMKKYIIGTISGFDQPLTPSQIGQKADELYFRKISHEEIQRERDEVLSACAGDIRRLAPLLRDVMEKNYICIIGSEPCIKENRDCFSSIKSIFDHK